MHGAKQNDSLLRIRKRCAMSNGVGKRIKAYMRKNDMSQNDLAHIVGVNQATVSNWINGKTLPDIRKLEKVAGAFGVDASVMLLNADDDKRKCNICGKEMREGFCIYDGLEYYCSDDCLMGAFSIGEYAELYANGDGYWTEWEDEQ